MTSGDSLRVWRISQALRDHFVCGLQDSAASVVGEEAGVAVSIGDGTRHGSSRFWY